MARCWQWSLFTVKEVSGETVSALSQPGANFLESGGQIIHGKTDVFCVHRQRWKATRRSMRLCRAPGHDFDQFVVALLQPLDQALYVLSE